MTLWRPSVDDFVDLAGFVLDADPDSVRRLPRLPLAEPAIHAPFVSFGGQAAYPTLLEQAAVLIEHLIGNHPLPDGNKRVSFLLMARFLEANGRTWGAPDVDEDAGIIERIAAGTVTHADVLAWIERRTTPA